ncbi:tyrosyl-DNA phosphodiesterase 2 isoform X1 [Hippocampus comes]|uniref:Tyrosyl-DNA phosphodiesterase 2 n=2 Tax=Hippocampus comes TaxID=109280 RepID=A0A3Q3E9U9_HIPCM|nr:PREDICTED: tyrosyl-DNA phosphodiesterase 2 isoform X1 [Hippocampus comes]XP_019729661.1 PREDICTED: tyrosyl-DNA phosphodiesterase 2 isoform X1 [Hippocampus comes]
MASTSDAEDVEVSRTRLCEEFAGVAGTDCGVAQCYLAENDWNVQRALNSFFEADMEKVFEDEWISKQEPSTKEHKVEEKAPVAESIDLTTDSPNSSRQSTKDDDGGSGLTIISWNVDGLDTENLLERARGLCSYLADYTPDVVFLQELIPPYVQYLKKRAVSYTIIQGGEDGYFTGMMLKKTRVKLLESQIVAYPTTKMMRNLLMAQVAVRGATVWLMTSHLESCKEHSGERMTQLREVMRRMHKAPDDVSVVFAGDTNLRDSEVTVVGLPPAVCDVWEQLGSREHCRYTWDTRANSNKNVRYVSRCRFDRIYLRPACRPNAPRLVPDHMMLVGLEKLDCGRFTSDHWGIYCNFTTTTTTDDVTHPK